MWNLSEEDLKRAKEELKGRRAAIQARYENELKQLETDIGDLETFERFATKFVADFKGSEDPAVAGTPAAGDVVAEIVAQVTAEAAPPVAEVGGESEAGAAEPIAVAKAEPAAGSTESGNGNRGSSRWRMRLNAGETAS